MEITQNTKRPHDKFVKSMLSEMPVAIDFFEANLPKKILDQIELKTLTLEPGTFVNRKLLAGYTDLLYKVQLKLGEEGYIFLLIEHLSGPDPLKAFQVSHYLMQVADKHIKDAENAKKNPLPLPLIFPIILYNGKKAYKGERRLCPLFGVHAQTVEDLFSKGFHLVDLSLEANQELRGQGWASLMSWCMRHSMQRDFLPYLSVLGLFFNDLFENRKPTKVDINRTEVMLYYMSTSMRTSTDSEALMEALYKELPSELEDTMATLGSQLIAKGKIEGKIEGEVEGISKTLDAITLVQQGLDNVAIRKQTALDLKTIQALRAKLLH